MSLSYLRAHSVAPLTQSLGLFLGPEGQVRGRLVRSEDLAACPESNGWVVTMVRPEGDPQSASCPLDHARTVAFYNWMVMVGS